MTYFKKIDTHKTKQNSPPLSLAYVYVTHKYNMFITSYNCNTSNVCSYFQYIIEKWQIL